MGVFRVLQEFHGQKGVVLTPRLLCICFTNTRSVQASHKLPTARFPVMENGYFYFRTRSDPLTEILEEITGILPKSYESPSIHLIGSV